MFLGLLSMGLAFGVLTISYSVPIILISVCFIGFGQGIIFPLINDKVLNDVDPALSDRVISIVSSMIYVGQFLSPVVLDSISNLVGLPEIRFQYSFLAVGLIVSFIVMIVVKLISKKSTMKKEVETST